MKFKLIRGYPGTQDIGLAMQRGELQGTCLAFGSFSNQSYYTEGKVNILFQAALQKDPLIPASVPLITEVRIPDADRQALNLFLARIETGRPFVAPPGVPGDRVEILRKAFADTMKDPEFIAETKKQHLNLGPITGAAIAHAIADGYKAPKEVVQRVNQILDRNDTKAGNAVKK
jgi:tripartite-type tricarboxylate transporter receptor subunit TctC